MSSTSSCCYSLAGSFQCFFNFVPRSHPLCLSFFIGRVYKALGSSSLLPSCLASISPMVLFRVLPLIRFVFRLPLSCGSTSVSCWLLPVILCGLLSGHPFLLCRLAFEHSFGYVGFLSSTMRIFSVLVFLRVLAFLPLPPFLIPPANCRLLISPGSSHPGIAFLHRFRLT